MSMDSGRFYRLVRTVHLWAALALAAGVAMYTVTGLFMLHPQILPDPDQSTSERIRLAALDDAPRPQGVGDASTLAVASIFERDLGLRGRFEEIRRARGSWIFTFRRPGTEEIVRWTPGNPDVEFRTQKRGIQTVLNRLHHLNGYQGGLRFWLWAAFLDLVSLSMFLFAATGVYLWYRTKQDRRLGWILLGGSTVFVITAIADLVFSP